MPEPLDPRLADLGRALASLAPASPAIDRDRILFEAGRAAAKPRPWGWLAAAGCAAVALAVWARPEVQRVTEVIVFSRSASASPEPPRVTYTALPDDGPAAAYLKLRNQVVTWGADALPAPVPPAARPAEPTDTRWKPTRGDV